jgi:hypothetical protein
VTVGVAHKDYSYPSMLRAVFMMIKNSLAALLPGSNRRRYVQVNAAVNPEALEKLRSMVEQGSLRVPIDSCWGMKDAPKVRSMAAFSRIHAKLTLICRRMTRC